MLIFCLFVVETYNNGQILHRKMVEWHFVLCLETSSMHPIVK